MSGMKALLATCFPPNVGEGRYAFEIFSEIKKNISAELAHCSSDNPVPETIYVKGKDFPILSRSLNWSFVYPGKLSKLKGFDVCHITNQFLAGAVNRMDCPVVMTCHDLMSIREKDIPLPSRLLQRYVLRNMKRAKMIIANSEYTKNDIVKTMGIPEEKIRAIHYGVDSKLFGPRSKTVARKRLGLPLDKKIVLHVGSEEPRKNIYVILEALKKIKPAHDDILFLRVGEKRQSTLDEIRTLGLSDSVIHRSASSKEVAYYYNAADVFVFPSLREGFGWPPLEAMASGCPVISSNCASVPEVVGDSAIVLEPHDAGGFGYNISSLFADKKLAKKMSSKGIKRSKKFSWKSAAKKTLEVYEEVV